ncbi:MAG: hypothetical protein UZ15_CFX003002343 [Chloroflexi bacterium OLB15]|nr:MAG: hypothetical protein UZ15_CFX003002343 [Chloroflexi bacterium OLB15]
MSALTIRRIIVLVIGLGAGALTAAIMVTVILPWLGPNAGIPISIAKYGYQYFLWTALPLGLFFVIWLDYFLKTKILPD